MDVGCRELKNVLSRIVLSVRDMEDQKLRWYGGSQGCHSLRLGAGVASERTLRRMVLLLPWETVLRCWIVV